MSKKVEEYVFSNDVTGKCRKCGKDVIAGATSVSTSVRLEHIACHECAVCR
jgi:hypothetical protein